MTQRKQPNPRYTMWQVWKLTKLHGTKKTQNLSYPTNNVDFTRIRARSHDFIPKPKTPWGKTVLFLIFLATGEWAIILLWLFL